MCKQDYLGSHILFATPLLYYYYYHRHHFYTHTCAPTHACPFARSPFFLGDFVLLLVGFYFKCWNLRSCRCHEVRWKICETFFLVLSLILGFFFVFVFSFFLSFFISIVAVCYRPKTDTKFCSFCGVQMWHSAPEYLISFLPVSGGRDLVSKHGALFRSAERIRCHSRRIVTAHRGPMCSGSF